MRSRGALFALVAVLVPIGLVGWLMLAQYTRAAGLVVLTAQLGGWPRLLARLHTRPVADRELTIPAGDGLVRARAYRPAGTPGRTVALITGIHPAGIDDPRLVHFARSMASVGLTVVTPELPQLVGFEITPAVTEAIEDVAAWTAAQPQFADDGRVGLAGISFSGGLAIVAAGRPRLQDRLAFVLSVGGHGDLGRVLEVLGGGVLGEEAGATADAVGLAFVLNSVAPLVVPGEQVAPLRRWGRTFLQAAHIVGDDAARGRVFAEAHRLAASLPEPAATLVRHARAGDSAALRPHLLRHVRTFAIDPALSPERAPPPRAPVYLLHGVDDPVIPTSESLHLARQLRPHTRVRVLLTPLLAHADVGPHLTARDAYALVSFVANLLRQAGARDDPERSGTRSLSTR